MSTDSAGTLLGGALAAVGIAVVAFWLQKPYGAESATVVLRATGCDLVRFSGVPVKDAGSGLCAVSGKLNAVSPNQAELGITTTANKKTFITLPFDQVAGYVQPK